MEIKSGGEFAHMAERFNAMAGELERWHNSNWAMLMKEKARAEAVINSRQDASIGVDEQERLLFVDRQALELLGLEGRDATDKSAAVVAQRNDLLRFVLKDRSGPRRSSGPFLRTFEKTTNWFAS